MLGKTIMINRNIVNDKFPIEIKCNCGHLIIKIEEFQGSITQDTKCTSCKSMVKIKVINKMVS